MRIAVRTEPRYSLGKTRRKELLVLRILQNNKRVTPVDVIGREAEFADGRTSLKYVLALAGQTGQVVRNVIGTYIVYPKDMTEREVLRQCQGLKASPRKKTPNEVGQLRNDGRKNDWGW